MWNVVITKSRVKTEPRIQFPPAVKQSWAVPFMKPFYFVWICTLFCNERNSFLSNEREIIIHEVKTYMAVTAASFKLSPYNYHKDWR
jgi:hypothetical protein